MLVACPVEQMLAEAVGFSVYLSQGLGDHLNACLDGGNKNILYCKLYEGLGLCILRENEFLR